METRDPDEFRYALNQTVIFLANDRLTNRILRVTLLSNNSPTFERFLIRSDQSTDWVPTSSMRMFYKPLLLDFLPASRGNIFRLLWHQST